MGDDPAEPVGSGASTAAGPSEPSPARDAADRCRQQLILTDEGVRLLDESMRIAEQVDADLQREPTKAQRAAVAGFLERVVSAAGVPVDG